ncbi:MAG TPA: acyl-CoA dehydrogenase family protein [Ilumatobacteraceae bacterium]|nr:acyl-CoA dehydrogenase family protein [Ilumatobacteraceae bacterium]
MTILTEIHTHFPNTLDPVESASTIGPALRSRAAEAESIRTLPSDLVDRAQCLGLTSLLLPRSFGGLETDPFSAMSALEILSHADGSAGWTLMISNASFFSAWLDPCVARELLPPVPFSGASQFGPLGRGLPTDGGFRLTGQWPFCSASPHAELFFNGMLVADGPAPRLRADGRPDWRFAAFTRHEAEVLDTWDALGLRGSGSHDVRTTDTFVPEEHVFLPFDTSAQHDGPLWRFSFWGLLTIMMNSIPIGIARHALDELAEIAPTKRRAASPDPIGASADVQINAARAETQLSAARALVHDAVGEAWDTACNGDAPSDAQQSRMQLAMLNAIETGVRVVDLAFSTVGASAVYTHSALGRCFRDIHTAAQHLAFSTEGFRNYGRQRYLEKS